ncbi:MAG: TonB-dependent receptor [Deltaproteobacteria bacterium]|nr:MAG: TonB-dependent receptor [Deltaproteobacteria bacterium]
MRKLIALITLVILTLPALSPAEETAKETLDEIVVTATRYDRPLSTVPADIQVITRKNIDSSSATTIPDVLRDLGGLTIRDFSGDGTQASVDIRGFGDGSTLRTLVLVDGRRINLMDQSTIKWLQIPLDRVERIEVIKGPGSVLYGDNAVGGVINIITRQGQGKPKLETGLQYGSYDRFGGKALLNGQADGFSYFLNGSYNESSGYRENSGFRAKDAGLDLGYDLNPLIHLSLSTGHHDGDFSLPGSLTEAQMAADRRQSVGLKKQDRAAITNDFASAGAIFSLPKRGELDLNLLYRYHTHDSRMVSWDSFFDADIDTIGFTPKYVLEHEIAGQKNKIVLGIDVYNIESDKRTLTAAGVETTQLKVGKDSVGYYLQDDISPWDNVVLSLGYRYERVKFSFFDKTIATGTVNEDRALKEKQEAASLGLSYLYGKDSSVFARFDKTYRYPASDEYFTWGTLLPDLRPEHGYSYEAGIRHSITPKSRIGLTAFLLNMEDEIDYNADTFQNENLDDTRHQGFELSGETAIRSDIVVFGSYTYTDVEFTSGVHEGHKLPLVPQNKIVAGVRCPLPMGFAFNLTARYTGKRYFGGDKDNQYDKMDDYTTVDMKVSWRWKSLDAFLSVNNIFDKEYAELGYNYGTATYYPMPERNFLAGVSYTF